ncbi:hypothetical protein ACR2WQ_000963 [Acinetobacter baumannii]
MLRVTSGKAARTVRQTPSKSTSIILSNSASSERIKPNQKLALAAWKAPAVANHASSVETKTSIAEGAQP